MKFKKLGAYRVGGTDSNMKLAIPAPKTPAGRHYRLSPNPDAHPRHFVIGSVQPGFEINEALRTRMKLEPRSDQTVCPYSGHIADDDEFQHPDDREAALAVVKHAVLEDVDAMVAGMFKNLGRSSSKHVKITTKTTRAHRPKPHFARSDLMRELVCDHCGQDYGVFAIALFCPDCGAPNVRLHFERERVLVGAQVDLAEAQDTELAELAYRLLGNAHEDVLTAFEATLKTVYFFKKKQADPDWSKSVGSDFQNIEKAERRFSELGIDPFGKLTAEERATLLLNIQKRHVIGHNLGIADAKFAEHAEEARVGETVRLVASDIKQFAAITQKVIDDLDAWLVGTPSPTIGRALPSLLETDVAIGASEPATLEGLDVKLGPLAREIAAWLAKRSVTGIGAMTTATGAEIREAFDACGPRELAKAIAELEAEGFMTTAGGIGREIPQTFGTLDLFAIFDPIAVGTNPYADACLMIDHILEKTRQADGGSVSFSAQALREQFGWSLRRLNPALGIVSGHIDDRHVSGEISGEYVVTSFFVGEADELALERLAFKIKTVR